MNIQVHLKEIDIQQLREGTALQNGLIIVPKCPSYFAQQESEAVNTILFYLRAIERKPSIYLYQQGILPVTTPARGRAKLHSIQSFLRGDFSVPVGWSDNQKIWANDLHHFGSFKVLVGLYLITT